MVRTQQAGRAWRAPVSHYVLAAVFGVIATAFLSTISGLTNPGSFREVFAITALCAAYPAFALGVKMFVTGHTVTVDAHGEQSIEVRWMERAGAGAFLDVLVATTLGAAALLITGFEVQAVAALIGLAAFSVVDVGLRYLIIKRQAS
ncbi:hypothetical protein [Rhodococcus sp. UNC363MFTsu5.1]|uniref:hypothetical protein n=1 Tax=Rhodococcus sp. UNC363MFTsu5.1 TaxID=1449069 RepID=UPI000485A346|nr:hypothetical protein [Rhodococcus sp. UNC363MFTsu5.1]